MKHTIKKTNGTALTTKKRMVGLRLEESEVLALEKIAKKEQRSLAQMARIIVRRGIENITVSNNG